VIHFDRWWNPAVENQATDRAHRIGQSKTVFVHVMITSGTIEERVDELLSKKSYLSQDVITSGESYLMRLEAEELLKISELK
jgi:SNF2 family DNA or RNA helicase